MNSIYYSLPRELLQSLVKVSANSDDGDLNTTLLKCLSIGLKELQAGLFVPTVTKKLIHEDCNQIIDNIVDATKETLASYEDSGVVYEETGKDLVRTSDGGFEV